MCSKRACVIEERVSYFMIVLCDTKLFVMHDLCDVHKLYVHNLYCSHQLSQVQQLV